MKGNISETARAECERCFERLRAQEKECVWLSCEGDYCPTLYGLENTLRELRGNKSDICDQCRGKAKDGTYGEYCAICRNFYGDHFDRREVQ
jgi:hypothetical protein